MAENTSTTSRIIAAWVMVAAFGLFSVILLPIALDTQNTEVVIGFGWFLFLMAALGLLLSLDWIPDSADDSCIADNDCHCEQRLTGKRKIRQPVNTWSDLGFVAAGLIIFYMLGAARLNGVEAKNPLQITSFYSIVYGFLVVYLGPGSMYYHASTKKWGGWLDNMSMVFWTFFLVIYVIARGTDLDQGIAALIWVGAVVLAGLLIWFVEGSGKYVFGVAVAVWGVLEIVILIAQATGGSVMGLHREEWGWLPAAAISFGLAIFIWLRSKDGKPWCYPNSWAQGHAAWHFLSALSAFFIFLYLRSEVMV